MAAKCGECECGEVGFPAEDKYIACVTEEILKRSPCKSSLDAFMAIHGDLSLEVQMHLIGPGGITSCGNGFSELVIESLIESSLDSYTNDQFIDILKSMYGNDANIPWKKISMENSTDLQVLTHIVKVIRLHTIHFPEKSGGSILWTNYFNDIPTEAIDGFFEEFDWDIEIKNFDSISVKGTWDFQIDNSYFNSTWDQFDPAYEIGNTSRWLYRLFAANNEFPSGASTINFNVDGKDVGSLNSILGL